MVQPSIELSSFKFIRLNSTDSIKRFDCGDRDLNDFILNHAPAFQKHLISVSYAYANPNTGQILAYCSLANDKVAITDFKDKTEFNRFRKKNGFRRMNAEDDDPHTRLMYYDLMDLAG